MHLLKHAPHFNVEAAAALAERLYGMRATATPLPSERDQNFLLVSESSEKFVLKIANALEDRALLEAQNGVMTHLASRLSFCPRIVPTLSGTSISQIEYSAGTLHFVRLLTWLPGVPLAEVKQPSPELLRSLGQRLGQLDRALAGFDHPAIHRNFHWDLNNGLRVIREYGSLVTDGPLRELIDRCARDFERDVTSLLPQLRRSVIHGDANDYNVLVSSDEMWHGRPARGSPPEAPSAEPRAGRPCHVVGLIDFGDMVHSYTVGELAVALAYAVLDKPDPIATATQVVAGYTEEYQLTDAEIESLWEMVLMRLCMSACLAAYQQQQQPENEYLEISQRSITNSLPRLAAIDRRVTKSEFRRVSGGGNASSIGKAGAEHNAQDAASPWRDPGETLAARQRLLGRNLKLAYKNPLKIVRGSMQYLYDEEGRQYLDAYNNVAHVGHCHPQIVKAGQDQMAQLNTNTRYLHDLINRYAARLTSTLPEKLSVCFFVNSGSEANELALRLARAHTNARDLLVLDHAYHGNTTTLIDISPYKHDGPGGSGPPPWVHKVPLPDPYRGLYRSDDPLAPHIVSRYAQHVADEIAQLRKRGAGLAGFIAESLPSVAGQIVLPAGYLERVYSGVCAAGGVCIADEVQTGYGRIGTHFWGFESYGVVPDIVVLGKPIGNGHPIGAVITTPEIASSFDNGMEFFSTFGGNTVSCAIGLAVLNLVLQEELQAHALRVGEQMLNGLRDLMNRHEVIGDIRGSGFFLGVELVQSRDAREPATSEADALVNRMRDHNILLGTDGPFHNVIKIRPPLPFSTADANRLIETMDKVLTAKG